MLIWAKKFECGTVTYAKKSELTIAEARALTNVKPKKLKAAQISIWMWPKCNVNVTTM